jgi:hypothetical protein
MAAGLRDGVDHFRAQLVSKLPQLAFSEHAEIRRIFHPVKQWGR